MIKRCDWCLGSKIYIDYHDKEWGVPLCDDRKLFEMLLLEGAQAGLSWLTVLKKRDAYKKAFDDFDPEIIALYDEYKISELMQNNDIIKNKLKINAFIKNSQIYTGEFPKGKGLSEFLWSFVDGKTIINSFEKVCDLPAVSDEAVKMSKALKKMGFCFVGPVSCYAFMQSVGMINDHIVSCFRYEEINASAAE